MPDWLISLLLDWGALFRPYARDLALKKTKRQA
jgi:hypothetical protein